MDWCRPWPREDYTIRAVTRRPVKIAGAEEVVVVPDLAGDYDRAALLQDVDIVIHLAGLAHAGSKLPEHEFDRVNRAGTAALAAAAAAANVERFIFISSARAQSGPAASHALSETDEPLPSDAYGRSKLNAEAAVRASGVRFTILRPVLIYGPGAKGNLATLVWIAGLPVPLPFGAIDNRRSFLAIENLVGACLHVIAEPATSGQTYLVADRTPATLAEIVTTLRRSAGRDADIFPVPPRLLEWSCGIVGRKDVWQRIGGSFVVHPDKLMASGWRPSIDTTTALSALAPHTAHH